MFHTILFSQARELLFYAHAMHDNGNVYKSNWLSLALQRYAQTYTHITRYVYGTYIRTFRDAVAALLCGNIRIMTATQIPRRERCVAKHPYIVFISALHNIRNVCVHRFDAGVRNLLEKSVYSIKLS